jgi:hypothetical protein
MATEYPPELKGFHTRNMLHVLLVFMIPATAGGWAFYRQEAFSANDDLQSTLSWIFMIGVGAFMVTILIKALIALPKCPKCCRKMKQLETIDITEKTVLSLKTTSRWRIVECSHCDLRYRIPGLSHG